MTKYDTIQCIINGYKIVENIHLTEAESYEEVRSWKERLFTFPWKPLVKYKTCCRIAKELRKVPF